MAVTPYKQLEQEWQRLHAFRGALSLLRWDAAVMMPRGSADVRGEQLAAIETEQHALLTSPKVSRLLERALAGSAALDDWQRANLREMSRQRVLFGLDGSQLFTAHVGTAARHHDGRVPAQQ
jgi:carboxypeptidase Taq